MMAPSSSHLQAAASPASSSVAGVSGNLKHPQEHPLEPSLYQIPVDLYPEYRPLPTSANVVIVSASILSSAMSTWKRATWLHPLAIVRGLKRIPSLGETISFVLKVSPENPSHGHVMDSFKFLRTISFDADLCSLCF